MLDFNRCISTLCGLLLGLSGSIAHAEGASSENVTIGGLTRSFEIFTPNTSQKNMSVVFVFHGKGGSGKNALEQGNWIAKAKAESFIVVAPDGMPAKPASSANLLLNPRSWNAGEERFSATSGQNVDDVLFVRTIIASVTQAKPIDRSRIFATGFSNGAAMAFRVGVELSDQISGIAPVANALLVSAKKLARPIPLLMIWGTEDPLNPYMGGAVKRSGQTLIRPSALDSLQRWSELLACTGSMTRNSIAPQVISQKFTECRKGTTAELISVAQLGHQWPGGREYLRVISGPGSKAIDATERIWRFFQSIR